MHKPLGFKKPLILSINVTFCIAFLFYVAYCGIPFSHSDGYKQLPKSFNHEDSLIKHVIPNKRYTYWAFCRNLNYDTVIYSFGKRPKNITLKPPSFFSELFVGCLPARCSKYIAYVDGGKVYYVQNIEEFKSFLGTIDNLQEAVLLAEVVEKLSIDDDVRGGAYMIKSDTIYNLHMMRYISCPETKQSVYLRIEKNGGIADTSTLTSYYKSKTCIVY